VYFAVGEEYNERVFPFVKDLKHNKEFETLIATRRVCSYALCSTSVTVLSLSSSIDIMTIHLWMTNAELHIDVYSDAFKYIVQYILIYSAKH